jgi:hypothetical protein
VVDWLGLYAERRHMSHLTQCGPTPLKYGLVVGNRTVQYVCDFDPRRVAHRTDRRVPSLRSPTSRRRRKRHGLQHLIECADPRWETRYFVHVETKHEVAISDREEYCTLWTDSESPHHGIDDEGGVSCNGRMAGEYNLCLLSQVEARARSA